MLSHVYEVAPGVGEVTQWVSMSSPREEVLPSPTAASPVMHKQPLPTPPREAGIHATSTGCTSAIAVVARETGTVLSVSSSQAGTAAASASAREAGDTAAAFASRGT